MSKAEFSGINVDWQSEMTRIATKHHVIVCWVAIILNPIWFVADYFTIPVYWKTFLVIRLSVALLTLLGVLFRKKLNISTEILIFIPVIGISLQNAYMWSVMDIPMLQKHAFAYIALFIGAGMLVLWKPFWSVLVVVLSFVANIFFLKTFSPLDTQEILINGGMLVATVAIISCVLIHSRYTLTKKEIIARLALAASNKELELKKDIIEEKNKDITDSINYAKKIQEALLPAMTLKEKLFPESFILFLPRDIVSGDFYWFTEKNGKKLIAAVDCTGHGVPGAFMSMIGNAFLNQVVNEKGCTQPAEILNQLRDLIIAALKQTGSSGENKDGMDISLLAFDSEKGTVEFAGANNPLWIANGNVAPGVSPLTEIKGNKQPIGIYAGDAQPFTNHEFKVNEGDTFYIFTDGFADQMGGTTGKKFRYKTFKELLLSLNGKTMKEQEATTSKTIKDWKGLLDQTDDILVMGIKA
ncbi:MAG: SpoIIE family protein phosphatase [Bacteroidota bacterium]|nr:SpoIIE family protein phosphatase [Bacteroidota bacterium]